MASDPNRWFELWDTFGSIFRSDGAAATKLQLSTLAMGELESLCGAAGIPVQQLGGEAKTEMVEDLLRNLACFREAGSGGSSFGCKTDCVCVGAAGCATREAGSSSSSGPQRLTQQSSQQLEEEAVIFEEAARLSEELGIRTPEGLWNLCAGVLRARGEHWMRERVGDVKKNLVVKLARKVGIRVEVSRVTKDKDVLIEEFMELFASATAAWLCMEAQLREVDEILEDEKRRNEKFQTMMTVAERLAMRDLAWMLGIRVNPLNKPKGLDRLGLLPLPGRRGRRSRIDATRLNEDFETLTVAERLAFCGAVLRARGL
eukprot:s702_g29.t1